MDFHSLLRRDLQFLCKRNKIPANITNVAMADALNSLEIVEGLDEYMNQSNSKVPQTPSSVARQLPNTSTRTTRRKATMTAEPRSLAPRSCRSTSKSLAEEMDQENINKIAVLNVAEESKTNNVNFEGNVPKTPTARSTRKVQERKKDEKVQSVYSTRRSTRLLEKSMGDLSLKARETLDKPAKNEDTEQKVSAEEKNPAVSETKIFQGRDLNLSMEQVWENLKNDSNKVVGDIGDIAVMDAHNEFNKEKMNSDIEVSQGGDLNVSMEQVSDNLKNDSDQVVGDLEVHVDLGDIAVMDAHNETNNEKRDSDTEGRDLNVSVEQVWENLKNDSNKVVGNLGDIAVMDAHNEFNKEKMNSEIEVSQGGDLNVSVEQVSDNLKNDSDQVVGDLEVHVDLGDIAVMDAHNETNNEKRDSDTEGRDLNVSVEQVWENLKNDSNKVVGNLGDIAVMDAHNEFNKEKMNSEIEVSQGGDLNVSVEQVSDNLKNDSDQVVGDLEVHVDLGDIAVMDAHNETNNEKMDSDTEGRDLNVSVEQVSENLKNDTDQVVGDFDVYVDLGDIVVMDAHNETNKEKKDVEQVSENLKNDTDQVVGDLEVYDGLGDIDVIDVNNETNKQKMDEVMSDDKDSENSLVQDNKQEETFHAICEDVPKKNDNDLEIYVDLGDITVLEHSNVETNVDDNESKNVLAFVSLVQADDQQETELVSQENESNTEEMNKSDEDRKTQENEPDQQETEQVTQEIESETVETNKSDEDGKTQENESDQHETEQVTQENESDQQETEQVTQENESDTEENNKSDEDSKADSDGSETEPEGGNSGVDSDSTISEADSNKAVLGSDISESEDPAAVTNSPLVIEEANKLSETTPVPPVIAESISFQFPRPSNSTTPLKNSGVKMVDENKENNVEMMMNNENKGEEVKKMKMKVEIDEENLKDVSMRQLVKMVKELTIKNSNRTALQILPGNNQTAE